MAVDIYLESVWKPFEEKLSSTPKQPPPEFESQADLMAFANSLFDELRASGGYFRNGYNSGDVMWAMGLSWHETVTPMLDDNGYLPVERASELVEMIEARPLTRERVAVHLFQNMTDGHETHPVNGPFMRFMEQAAAEATGQAPPPLAPPDIDHLHGFLNTRRDELLVILRKSIELNEQLLCSL